MATKKVGKPRKKPGKRTQVRRQMSDHDIRKLALDTASGEVFWAYMIPDNDNPGMHFLPLMFANKKQIADMERRKIVQFYEYRAKGGYWGINGMPTFDTMHLINEPDYQEFQVQLAKAARLMHDFLHEDRIADQRETLP